MEQFRARSSNDPGLPRISEMLLERRWIVFALVCLAIGQHHFHGLGHAIWLGKSDRLG